MGQHVLVESSAQDFTCWNQGIDWPPILPFGSLMKKGFTSKFPQVFDRINFLAAVGLKFHCLASCWLRTDHNSQRPLSGPCPMVPSIVLFTLPISHSGRAKSLLRFIWLGQAHLGNLPFDWLKTNLITGVMSHHIYTQRQEIIQDVHIRESGKFGGNLERDLFIHLFIY